MATIYMPGAILGCTCPCCSRDFDGIVMAFGGVNDIIECPSCNSQMEMQPRLTLCASYKWIRPSRLVYDLDIQSKDLKVALARGHLLLVELTCEWPEAPQFNCVYGLTQQCVNYFQPRRAILREL